VVAFRPPVRSWYLAFGGLCVPAASIPGSRLDPRPARRGGGEAGLPHRGPVPPQGGAAPGPEPGRLKAGLRGVQPGP